MEFQDRHPEQAFKKAANRPSDDETRHLAIAAMCGNLDRVQDFITRYPDAVDATTSYGNGWTPLMWAARDAQFPVIDFLLERGAKVDNKNRDGYSVLDIATLHNYSGFAKQIEHLQEKKTLAEMQHRNEKISRAFHGGTTQPLALAQPLRFNKKKS